MVVHGFAQEGGREAMPAKYLLAMVEEGGLRARSNQ